MLTAIKRQAVGFRPDKPIPFDNADLCQLVNRTDSTQFQVILSPSDNIEMITDGTFDTACGVTWTCGGDWDITGSKAVILSVAGTNILSEEVVATTDFYYGITLTISNYVEGSLAVNVNGGNPSLTSGNGTKTLLVKAGNSNTLIQILASTQADFTVDNVSMQLFSSVGLRIQDLDGAVLYEETDGTSINYSDQSFRANIEIDWTATGVADGCVELCLFDTSPANIVQNGTFTGGGANWDVSGSSKWSFGGDVAIGDATGGSSPIADRQNDQLLSLPTGHKYELTYSISGFTSGTVRPFTDDIGLTVRSANGTFTEIIDVDDDLFPDQTFLRFTLSDNAGKLDIDNVVLFEINETKDCVLTSECFKLLDDHSPTVLITNTMNGNAFGLDYLNFPNFVQSFRHEMQLHYMETEHWRNKTWRDSRGTPIRVTVTNVEITRLHMTLMKDYMHRYMSNALTSDGFFVDGVQFGYEANTYIPEKSLDTNLSVGNAEIIEQSQFFQNNNC